MIKISLADGQVKEFAGGTSILDIAKSISRNLSENAMAGEINGEPVDLRRQVVEDCAVSIVGFESAGGRVAYRHTSSHIMAQAVKRLYNDVKLAIGPAIDNGFYYDFDMESPFSSEDLEKIENEMNRIIKEDLPLERFTLSRDDAIRFFTELNEGYKVELIKDLPEGEEISLYKQGEFTDLCAGPHLMSTGKVKAVKLTSVAGAYWRGSEKNKMLQRIYGTSFQKKAELDEYLERLEEAKKRDHRKIGRELDLFDIYEEGPGFPFLFPKGMIIRNILEDYWRKEHRKAGYDEIKTPIILNEELWHRSGHWDHYKENMYFTVIDEQNYAVKPMNCPGAMLAYGRKLNSYRDLPMRICELGLVHRHELSGALHGLVRVRCFTQDDAHIFMTPEMIKDEVQGVINLVDRFYTLFGLKYRIELSTKPENSMGSDEDWELATNALKDALESAGRSYTINEGDGAFYGPKIDFQLEDAIGRTWQCGTIQLDFQMPERFDLSYIGPDGHKHRPVMIHRVIYGSIERFIAILTEHFVGAFPIWLAPVQVRVLSIMENQAEYAKGIFEKLEELDIRAELDNRNEKIGYKVRDAQLSKAPYMLIVGGKEVENSQVSVRSHKDGDLGKMSLEQFIEKVSGEIKDRAL
ncbi:MAG: threonine--tRNA ligase [Oscillospiraceae bacterium]|nr:threonine--tRNA ligase [Oscillospiraceae bacterium]